MGYVHMMVNDMSPVLFGKKPNLNSAPSSNFLCNPIVFMPIIPQFILMWLCWKIRSG